MSFVMDQLLAANSVTPEEKPSVNAKKERWGAVASKGWEEHTRKTIIRYREAMKGKGWLTSYEIECRLGYARTSATPFIKRLLKDFNLIERRNKDGAKTYTRKSGYQYRWIGD